MKRYGKITALILSAFMCVQLCPGKIVLADDNNEVIIEETEEEIVCITEENEEEDSTEPIEESTEQIIKDLEVTTEAKEYMYEDTDMAYIPNEWYKDFDYEIDGNSIILTKYNGTNSDVTIPRSAVIDGEEYIVSLKGGKRDYITWGGKIKNLVFEDGFIMPENSSRLFFWSGFVTIDFGLVDTSHVKDMSEMFGLCNSLKSINITAFDTSQVTDMGGMFFGCNALENIDVTGFNTSQVTDMSVMFSGCNKLQKIDVTGFDTSNVTNMSGMFSGCNKLQKIDVTGFDTRNVTNMSSMFSGCGSIEKLDLSGLNTSKVTDVSYMFSGVPDIKEFDMTGFDTSCVVDMSGLFQNSCFEEIDITGFDTSNVTNMSAMFRGCNKLQKLDLEGVDTSNVTNMGAMFSGCNKLQNLDLTGFDTSKVINMSEMFSNFENSLVLELTSFETSKVTNMSGMFSGCESGRIDLSTFTIEDTTNCDKMFDRCVADEIIAPKNLNIDIGLSVIYFDSLGMRMLYLPKNNSECIKLTKKNSKDNKEEWYLDYLYKIEDNRIILTKYIGSNPDVFVPKSAVVSGKKYDTLIKGYDDNIWYGGTKVKSIDFEDGFVFPENSNGLFRGLTYLEKIDLSGVDSSNVTDMGNIFSQCQNLTDINFSGFDTSNVTNFYLMFECCTKLEKVDVSGFNTESAITLEGMFYACKSLKEIELKGFNTSKVQSIGGMFAGCESLEELDLSHFDSSNVTDVILWSHTGLFQGCSNLERINLSGFNTSNIGRMGNMFSGCTHLKSIDLSSFDTQNAWSFEGMFDYCSSLEKINLCSFNTSNIGNTQVLKGSVIRMFSGCKNLKKLNISNFTFDYISEVENGDFLDTAIPDEIVAPANVSIKVELPTTYYDYAGNSYTELPRNQKSSIIITKTKPTINGFNDVKDSKKYFYSPVYWALDNGITKGTTATTFSPDNPCTRGQFVTFLWRLAGEPKASKETQFNDVKNKDAYYYKAVMWAAEEGITTGTGKGNFSPDDVCTRAQCVTFIYRAAGKPNVSEEVHNKYSFTDVKKSDFSYDPVAWAASQNITTGVGNNRFAPNDKCNRGMLVTFLYRYAGE